jgi:hypothetical protein
MTSQLKQEIKMSGPTPRTEKRIYLGVVAAALGAWAFTGFMGPDTLVNGFFTHSECVRFAKEKNVFVFDDSIQAVNFRTRGGKWVVDLIAHTPGKKEIKSRTCVVDGNTIQIVSLLQEGFWR